MSESLMVYTGARVRCRIAPGDEGPSVGWLGTVFAVDREEGLFVVTIAWDAVRGNRAERRAGLTPLHFWGFQDETLAANYLQVITVGASGNA
ncbi:MAG TPA: hypothetical protein VEU32_13450 [Burkholderiales bacterium]|nr:hypothetical protein [Burkholderiales bacterium]